MSSKRKRKSDWYTLCFKSKSGNTFWCREAATSLEQATEKGLKRWPHLKDLEVIEYYVGEFESGVIP